MLQWNLPGISRDFNLSACWGPARPPQSQRRRWRLRRPKGLGPMEIAGGYRGEFHGDFSWDVSWLSMAMGVHQKWMVYFVENPGKSHGKGIFWLGFSMVLPISGNLHTKMQYTSRVNLRFPQENHQTRGFSSPTDCKYMWLHPPENTIGKPQENGDVSKKNRDLIGVVADFW